MDEERKEDEPERPRGMSAHEFTTMAIVFELSLIPAAWLLAWIWPGRDVPPAEWIVNDALSGLLWTLPLLGFLVVLTWKPVRSLPPIRRVHLMLRRRMGSTFAKMAVWQIVAVAAAAGIGEEVLFRGALQPRAGIWWTAIVFGMVHFITPTYFIFATAMGLYLGWRFRIDGNLLGPMIVHGLYDAVALMVLREHFRRRACFRFSERSPPS